jgi:hypothetical protein
MERTGYLQPEWLLSANSSHGKEATRAALAVRMSQIAAEARAATVGGNAVSQEKSILGPPCGRARGWIIVRVASLARNC